jgi:molybdopterin converting factor small subunit
MNKFAAFAAAGVLSVSALIAGQASAENENSAFAQMVQENTYGHSSSASSSGTVGYGYNAGFIARAAHQSSVNVRYVSELSDAVRQTYLDRAAADPAAVKALQSQISSQGDVLRGLQERNISLGNVIGSISAADGSVTYIVR